MKKTLLRLSIAILLVFVYGVSERIFAQIPVISYTSPQNYVVGTEITQLAPTNTGGAVPVKTFGQVETLSGTGTSGFVNGTGVAASFSSPNALVVDQSGNLYVSDGQNSRIRKISTSGVVSTFAGGSYGYANGTGSAAKFTIPMGIAIDILGNLYVADFGSSTIRKITPAGVVSTVAGTGTTGFANGNGTAASFNSPTGVAVDKHGNLYVADQSNYVIRKISSTGVVSTFAGSGIAASTNGIGISASFNSPVGIAIDQFDNVYVSEQNSNKIRKITPDGVVSTLAGSGAFSSVDGPAAIASFYSPRHLCVDSLGNVYVPEFLGYKIRVINNLGVVSTIAGTGIQGSVNGVGNVASFFGPSGIARDGQGNMYIADLNNHLIRKISVTGYTISPVLPSGLSFDSATGIVSGTPTAVSPSTVYTVIATNTSGTDTTTLTLSTVTTLSAPIITSFSPFTGNTGSSVVITGTNFNSTSANNIVYFGAVKATVTAATTTSLTVTVPLGATFEPITVTTNNLTTYSSKPFIVTFPGNNNAFTSGSFTKTDIATGSKARNVMMGDIDGDEKSDLVMTNQLENTISIYRNNSSGGTVSFLPKVVLAGGNGPVNISIADYNSDSKLDLAVTNYSAANSCTISIFKNTSTLGNISFDPKIDLATGIGTFDITTGDLNLDGKPDLAVANQFSNTVSIFRNTSTAGNISFDPKADIASGNQPWALELGDLNGDGKLDMSVLNRYSNTVSVFKNITTGSSILFAPKIDYATDNDPLNITLTDIDGDTKLDMTILNTASSSVSIYKNTSVSGNLGFATKISLPTGTGPNGISYTDLDGDSKIDLVIANYNAGGAGTISLYKNSSSSGVISFLPKVDYTAGNGPCWVSIGDLDGDTRPDLAVSNYYSENVFIYQNKTLLIPSITSFSPASGQAGITITITGKNFSPTAVNNIVYFGAVKSSVISATETSLTVSVPIGATFQPISVTTNNLTAYSSKPFIVTIPDAGVINSSAFALKSDFSSGIVNSVVLGDLDNDGKSELITTNDGLSPHATTISILKNTGSVGNPSFGSKINFTTGESPRGVAVGDLNGDGKLDLVTTNQNANTASILINTTAGTISFAPKIDLTTGISPVYASIGDIDGDGKPDVVLTNSGEKSVSVFRNTSTNGNVTFAQKINFSAGSTPTSVAISDFDGDGKPDLAVTSITTNDVMILRNVSSGNNIAFEFQIGFNIGNNQAHVSVGDLNADGKPDLVIANDNSHTISILKNTSIIGTILFAAKIDYPTGSNPRSIGITDLNGDGKLDIAVSNFSSNTISIFSNTSTNSITFAAKMDFGTGQQPLSIAIGDLDGDGKSDLAAANSNSFASSVSVLRNKIVSVPTINTFTPALGGVGTSVTINGKNFTGATAVKFGGTTATSFIVNSATSITAVVGAGGTGDVSVTTPDGVTSKAGFTFIDAPTITSFNPTSASAGATVTITGTGFSNTTSVLFGATPASSFTIISPTSIKAVVASGSTGSLYVYTSSGKTTATGFNFIAAPTITSFTPSSAASGTAVTITGTNFTGTTAVTFEGIKAASYTVNSATSITVILGTGATGNISVTSPGGTSSIAGFTYLPPPAINSFSPDVATEGTSVTINGSNFTGITDVKFGGTAASSFTINSATQITAIVSSGASGDATVKNANGTGSKSGFKYVSKPFITANGPTTFTTGSSVVLTASTGTGFIYKWTKNGTTIPVATSESYTATESGSYKVSIVAGSTIITTSDAVVVRSIFTLPLSNFKISTTGETCRTANNGSINIIAATPLNYTATITRNGTSITSTFNTLFTANNLPSGSYNICITVEGQAEYKQCFDVQIAEPEHLSVYTAIDKSGQKISLTLDGSSNYTVELNGISHYTTKNELTLNLEKGNNVLKVSTDKDCQGVVEKKISLSDEILMYPNPFENTLTLSLGNDASKQARIAISSLDGKLVYSKTLSNQTGIIELDLSNLNTGLHMLKLSLDTSETFYKILKK